MNALPANLPNISTAKLPATYEAAKTALMECDRIDECMAWADKMAALASYAKQIEDEELEAIVLAEFAQDSGQRGSGSAS